MYVKFRLNLIKICLKVVNQTHVNDYHAIAASSETSVEHAEQ